MAGSEPTFFDRVVAATGLNELVAPFTVSRLLVRAGVHEPRNVGPGELSAALPELERGIGVYLGSEDCERAMARLRALVAPA